MIKKDVIYDILKDVIDPDVGYSIIDMGLIYDIEVFEDKIEITYTLTTPACPVGDIIEKDIIETIKARTDYSCVFANLTWEPLWSPNKMSDELKIMYGINIEL